MVSVYAAVRLRTLLVIRKPTLLARLMYPGASIEIDLPQTGICEHQSKGTLIG
jgi:hypothetical protein